PSCIEEKTYDLCFGDPLYRRLQKLVGNDKVMADAALGADPFTHIKREVLHNMLTIMTRFTGRIPTVNFDEGSSRPLAFIFQLADELTPSHITDGFCQTVIFDHVLDSQTLHADHLVFVDDACRKLVLVVSSTILDTSMHTGHLASCFLPVLGALLFLGMPTLGFCQSLLILGIVTGIAHSFTSREDHHRFETQVK